MKPLIASEALPPRYAEGAQLCLPVQMPPGLDPAAMPSLINAVEKALSLLAQSQEGHVVARADVLAQLAAGLVEPQMELLEDRIRRMRTINEVFAATDWLTAEQLNALQASPPANKSLPASDWKRRGRVFSVNYQNKEYFARYQFDATYQPLPVIRQVLAGFGEVADAWTLAAWFHFPNRWLERPERSGVAPKDALDSAAAVVKAASKRLRSYIA